MDTIITAKQNLINGLLSLKNQFPDCIWLKECLEMNRLDQKAQIDLAPQIVTQEILISKN